VDLLGDGYSSFVYEKYLLLTATNAVAIAGTEMYGIGAVPATFDPPNEAYGHATPPEAYERGEIFLDAYTNLPYPAVTTHFYPLPFVGPWPLDL